MSSRAAFARKGKLAINSLASCSSDSPFANLEQPRNL